MTIDDKDIFKRLSKGDKSAFEYVFKNWYPDLCRFAFNILKDMDEAEEIVQGLFMKIWETRTSIQINASLKSYLFRSVYNNCLNSIRHQQQIKKHEAYILKTKSLSEPENQEVFDLHDHINKGFQKLSDKTAEIFILSRNEGLKYIEISEKLNISVKTVEAHMSEAFKIFRKELKDFLPEYLKKNNRVSHM